MVYCLHQWSMIEIQRVSSNSFPLAIFIIIIIYYEWMVKTFRWFFFFDRIIGQTFTSKNHNSWSNNWQDLPVCLFVCRVKLIDLNIHWNSMIDRSRNTMYQLYEFWAANINYERLSFVKKYIFDDDSHVSLCAVQLYLNSVIFNLFLIRDICSIEFDNYNEFKTDGWKLLKFGQWLVD